MRTVRILLAGLGFVNRGLLRLLVEKEQAIAEDSGLRFKVTGVADSSGVALDTGGFKPEVLLRWKSEGRKAIDFPGYSSGLRTEDFAGTGIGDILVEATPANMVSGNPGLTAARNALLAGVSVVFANKAPLVFGFDDLQRLTQAVSGDPFSEISPAKIAYSATVCGGLPVVNVLKRDLRHARISRIRGVLNATSNYILDVLSSGGDFQAAVREAQRLGAAEADPAHDIKGHDTANKLYILARTIGGKTGSYLETSVTGIEKITAADLSAARARGNTIRLVATGIRENDKPWSLSVIPEEIPEHSFLGECRGWEMGVEIESDLYERVSLKNYEADPLGTSAAVLRDLINLSAEIHHQV